MDVTAVPLDSPEVSGPVKLQNASADFSQSDWNVQGAIDDNAASGWAISPNFGVAHEAVFEFSEDLGGESGSVLFLELDQHFGTSHTIGHLRISTTSSPRPIRHHGLGDDVARAMAIPSDQRTETELSQVYAEFVRRHPEVAERIRLGAAQDLAWALAGSPAFLFNR